MDSRKMQESLEMELMQFDPFYETKNKLSSSELFYFLSRAERDYVNDIYVSGVDRNEENRKKLGALLSEAIIEGDDVIQASFYPSSYTVILPEDLLYTINERCTVDELNSNIYIKPISFDEYNTNKDNPFRRPVEDKYLRLDGMIVSGEETNRISHTILTPDTIITRVMVDYIKIPLGISVTQNCELHESVHYNIIKGAVKLILAAKQDQVGYQLQSIEETKNK